MNRHVDVKPASRPVGEEIQARREALGLNREGLAYLAGISLRTLDRIENGEVTPRRATVSVIEQALDRYESDSAEEPATA